MQNSFIRRALEMLTVSSLAVVMMTGCGSSAPPPAESASAPAESAAAPQSEAASESEAAPQSEAAPESAAAPEGQALNINVILKTLASEYWGYVVAGANAYGTEHPNVKVNIQGAASEQSFDEWIQILETNLSTNQYDAFVLAPLQADAAANVIKGKTVPIVTVDTNIDAPEVLSFIGTGNEAATEGGGKAAIELAKSRGWTELNAVIIAGTQGDATSQARIDGYTKGIEAAGGKIVDTQYGQSNPETATAITESIISNNPGGVAVIVCHNDDSAIAAARAIKGNEAFSNTVVCGFDGTQSACNAILAGDLTMSVAQSAYQMGYKSVEAAVAAVGGETLEKFIDSGSSVIDETSAQTQLDSLKAFLGQ